MDTHPPAEFQIEGSLNAVKGTLEALVRSRWTPDSVQIALLPDVPAQHNKDLSMAWHVSDKEAKLPQGR